MIKELVQQNLQRAKETATIIARKGAEEYKKHPELYRELAINFVGNLLFYRLGIKLANKINPDLMDAFRQQSDRKLAYNALGISHAGLAYTERNLPVGIALMTLKGALSAINTEQARKAGYEKGRTDATKQTGLVDFINQLNALTPDLPPFKPDNPSTISPKVRQAFPWLNQ